MESVSLPRCFGRWAECVLCRVCLLDYACRLHGQTPLDLRLEIAAVFVANLSPDQQKDVAAWVDVLQGLE